MTAYDKNAKAPGKLVKDFVINHISEIEGRDLTESDLLQPNNRSTALAQNMIRDCLEVLLCNLPHKSSQSKRDDQACLSALACFTLMDVPQILHKLLF